MKDRQFEMGGRDFSLNKIDAIKQFHIVRRIGPILSDLLPAMKGLAAKNIEGASIDDQLEHAATIFGPIMTGLQKLSDADAELVLYGLLASVEVKQTSGNWAKIATGNPPMLMMQDLELPQLLQIAGRAFAYNLTGFFTAHRSAS